MAKKTTKKTAKTAKKAVKKAAKKTAKAAPKPPVKKPAPKAFQEGGIFADVEHLMDIMVTHDVTEVAIEDGKRKINLRRGAFIPPVAGVAAPVAAPVAAAAPAAAPADAKPADNCIEITSPMVGTFYAASSPDSDPYAQLGDKINDSTVVCIVEAMKVMNEIKAECSGEIVEVCVKNAEPVEFGQVLFRVKP